MQTLSALIAGVVLYCKFLKAAAVGVGSLQKNYEVRWDGRVLTMSPLFLWQSVLGCKAIKAKYTGQDCSFLRLWLNPPGLPSWGLSDGQAQTQAHVHVHTHSPHDFRLLSAADAQTGRKIAHSHKLNAFLSSTSDLSNYDVILPVI